MPSNTIFYLLSAVLIFLSILIVILPKAQTAIAAAVCFFLFSGVLFILSGAYPAGIFQILVLSLLTGIILFICGKKIGTNSENITKNPKFWTGLIFSVIIFLLIGLFIYYFNNAIFEDNTLFFSEKNDFNTYTSLWITLKSLFSDYFLAYGYMIFIVITVFGSVCLLVSKKACLQKEDEDDWFRYRGISFPYTWDNTFYNRIFRDYLVKKSCKNSSFTGDNIHFCLYKLRCDFPILWRIKAGRNNLLYFYYSDIFHPPDNICIYCS